MKNNDLNLRIFCIVTCFLISTTSICQENETKQSFKELTKFIETWRDSLKIPGLAVSIVMDSSTVYSECFGVRDIDSKARVNNKTLFQIGSISKPFTSLCFALLEENKLIEWEKPIINYMPEFRLKNNIATLETTPIDLLSHRVGLGFHSLTWYLSDFSREELFSRMRYLDFRSSFREEFFYNNILYTAAGYIVGELSGTTWEDFVFKNIFSPLNMKSSCFSSTEMKNSGNFAKPYLYRDNSLVEIKFHNFETSCPAAGIISNLDDMTNWMTMLINNGKFDNKLFISRESLNIMLSPHMTIGYIKPYDGFLGALKNYGLGWDIQPYKGNYVVYHGGYVNGFVAWTSIMPRKHIGIVVLSNRGEQFFPELLTYKIYDYLLDIKDNNWEQIFTGMIPKKVNSENQPEKRKKITKEIKGAFNKIIGEYHNEGYGKITIEYNEDVPILVFNNTVKANLYYINEYFIKLAFKEIYFKNEYDIRMEFDINNEVKSLHIAFEDEIPEIEFKMIIKQ